MRVPLSWLREYAPTDLDARELAVRLAMTGTEVERVTRHGVDKLEHFVVGRVISAEQHPDADRLRVCLVDVGAGAPAQIVCGAPNVAAGQTVAVARPGAVMPDGTQLGVAKLRGQVSHGMILAEDELAIGTDHAGILVLDTEVAPGSPLSDQLELATDVLELEITPNRPDCLGVYGVAREVHAATATALRPPPWEHDAHPAGDDIDGVAIDVRCPDLCPRFTARAFEDVTIGPSPPWLKARLMAAGQRPISNVVDITNYVMLLSGQPLHAFDLDRVAGARLVIRRAEDGEQVTTLDGQVRTLTSADVVIDDADGPTSIAGVMGGERSEVSDATTRVLMEVACWDGPTVNRTSTRLALRSEASGRNEKGLAPEQALDAQVVASALMVELCGATALPGTIDVGGPGPAAATIRLRDARVAGLLGAAIDPQRQASILQALGFDTRPAPDGIDAAVPYWRRDDVTREVDLIEEVARIDGVDDLPLTLPPRRRPRGGGLTRAQRLRRRAQDVLVGRGLYEVAGWSFAARDLLERLRLEPDSPMRSVIALENPMSESQAILRPSILGSLLDAAATNIARGTSDLGLFESAAVYRDGDAELADEHHALGVLLTGRVTPPSWRGGEPPRADAFAAKALLEAVLRAVRVDWTTERATWPFLHPGRSAAVLVGGERIGFLGDVHPLVAAAWEIEQPVAAFAVDLDRIIAAAPGVTGFADLVSFPALRNDLAVVVDADVGADAVLDVVRRAGGPLVAGARVFDLYRGEQVGEGRISLAVALEFRAADRTLADADVVPLRERIVAALRDELGGELRG